MTPAVVTVGPKAVRGPKGVASDQISVALAFIDDPLALVDGEPVDVTSLWRDVLDAVAGERADPLVLVVPTWWSQIRVGVVSAAAADIATDVVVLQRSALLADRADGTVVELSDDYVVIVPPASEPTIVARDTEEWAAALETADAVLIDVPAGVPPLSATTIAGLRRRGIPVTHGNDDRLCRAALAPRSRPREPSRLRRIQPGPRWSAVLAGGALAVAAGGGAWAAQDFVAPRAHTRLLVEGGVAVQVPAHWGVERITSGSGSARVRVSAPGGAPALHIAQSTDRVAVEIAEVARSLKRAIDSEAAGVFVDFDPSAQRAGRDAVTYVERRAAGDTRWTVFLDGAVRIAIGCQAAPADPAAVEQPCLQALQSAHAVQ